MARYLYPDHKIFISGFDNCTTGYYWNVDTAGDYRARSSTSKAISPDKPLVFYFGGMPTMNIINEAPERSICQEIGGYLKEFSADDYALTIVTEASGNEKYELATHYNSDPHRYCSANAKEFAQDILMPFIKNAQTLDDIKKQFSRVNLIGHSYGSSFIQNVSNALFQELKTKTLLSEGEIVQAMRCIAALNIGPTCTAANKKGDFTQIFAVSTQDEAVSENVDYEKLVNDKHSVLAHQKMGSNLILLSKNMGEHLLKLVSDKRGLRDTTSKENGGHSLRLHMNITGDIPTDSDQQLRTFQVNPSAHILREYLDTIIEKSLESIKTQKPRNMESVIAHIEATKLTSQSKDEIDRQMKSAHKTMSKFIIAAGVHKNGV